jgi:hypothetical protein
MPDSAPMIASPIAMASCVVDGRCDPGRNVGQVRGAEALDTSPTTTVGTR